MAKLPSVFNKNDHNEMQTFDAMPAGDYIFKISGSEFKKCGANAKDPNGQYLKLEFECLTPKFKGRKHFVNLNLINKNEKAVEIANSELASICGAVGKVSIQDSAELHGIPMMLTLAVVPDSRGDAYPPQNEIRKYARLDANGFAVKAETVAKSNDATPSQNPAPVENAGGSGPGGKIMPWDPGYQG